MSAGMISIFNSDVRDITGSVMACLLFMDLSSGQLPVYQSNSGIFFDKRESRLARRQVIKECE